MLLSLLIDNDEHCVCAGGAEGCKSLLRLFPGVGEYMKIIEATEFYLQSAIR
jgi:hypothetical protein